MLFLISYKFTDANAQDKGSKMLKEWYDKGGPQNRPEGYDVKSWIFLPQHGNGYSVVDADSLATIGPASSSVNTGVVSQLRNSPHSAAC